MNSDKSKEYLDNEFKRHQPKIIMPIINSIFAIAFIGLIFYLTINKTLKPIVLIAVIFLMALFVVASWYTSYFSKKRSQKKLYNFQEETELLIEYLKSTNKKVCINMAPTEILKTKIVDENIDINTEYTFNEKTRCFEPNIDDCVLIQFGVTCAGLAVDKNTKQVIGVKGMAPCSIWLNKKLNEPEYKEGQVFVDFGQYRANENTIFKYSQRADTYYNAKNGWLVMGRYKLNALDEVIKIAPNVLVVIYNDNIEAIWIHIQENIAH